MQKALERNFNIQIETIITKSLASYFFLIDLTLGGFSLKCNHKYPLLQCNLLHYIDAIRTIVRIPS